MEPGIQDKNSKFPIPLSLAKLEILRSSVAAPTSIVFLSNKLILEKFGPSLITTPLIPLSLIKVFDPAPNIVIENLFFLL